MTQCKHDRQKVYRSVYLSLLRSLRSGIAFVAMGAPRRNLRMCSVLGGLWQDCMLPWFTMLCWYLASLSSRPDVSPGRARSFAGM